MDGDETNPFVDTAMEGWERLSSIEDAVERQCSTDREAMELLTRITDRLNATADTTTYPVWFQTATPPPPLDPSFRPPLVHRDANCPRAPLKATHMVVDSSKLTTSLRPLHQ